MGESNLSLLIQPNDSIFLYAEGFWRKKEKVKIFSNIYIPFFKASKNNKYISSVFTLLKVGE